MNSNASFVLVALIIAIAIILVLGDPDLLDAVISQILIPEHLPKCLPEQP